jgi:hypothetical protein
MLPYDLEELTSTDVRGLIDADVAEGLRLEYKRALCIDSSEMRKKFLSRVSGMANAAGGDIVFGISDRKGEDDQNTGIADKISGMRIVNEGKTSEAITNLIRNGIAPRLSGVTMKAISCPDGDIFVVRIPPSWNKPHMVTLDGVNKFYTRTAIGVSPMSVDEIGRAFSEQHELREAIDKWRADRAELILSRKGPALLSGEVVMQFHLIPAEAFTRGIMREPWRFSKDQGRSVYVTCGNYHQRYNADGFLCLAQFGGRVQPNPSGYTQIFRSGIIEYANGNHYGVRSESSGPVIWGQELEKEIVSYYEDALRILRSRGALGVVYAGFTLVGIEGKTFYITPMASVFRDHSIRQDVFISPEVFVDIHDPEERPYARTLMPLIDTMWQVAGLEGTPFHDNMGTWKPFAAYE